MRRISLLLALCFYSTGGGAASSLSRCQCNYDKWVGTCVATIQKENNWARITSDTQQCSRVDWFIDGNPQMTVVTNGLETEPLLNVKPDSKLVVQSCNVCQDAMMPGTKPPAPDNGSQRQSTRTKTPEFAGTWTGTERNIFGFGHSITARLAVQGSSLTGTWQGDKGTNDLSGSVNGANATVSLTGAGAKAIQLQLIDSNTLKYSFGFGSGTLKRSQ